MFSNPGDKIKKLAIFLFVISCICFVVLAIVFGWTECWSIYSGKYLEFKPLYFFGFLCGGPVVSYILTLFLLAFGELVQNSESIKANMKAIKESQRIVLQPKAKSTIVNTEQHQIVLQQNESSTNANPQASDLPPTNHMWRCSKCGNMISHEPCPYCGESL